MRAVRRPYRVGDFLHAISMGRDYVVDFDHSDCTDIVGAISRGGIQQFRR